MPKTKYPGHEALDPFFAVVMKGLKGLVDGDHYIITTLSPTTPSLNFSTASPDGRRRFRDGKI